MPETPEQLVARALEAADHEGRLAMPPVTEWDTFPFDGDIRVRPFHPTVEPEKPRAGEDRDDCWRCEHHDGVIWSDENWQLSSLPKPSGLPVVVILFPRAHYDIDDLPPDLAAGLGPTMIRIEAAIRSASEIGRVHICRWGDGSAHLHFWFMARPARVPQLRGSFAAIWDDIVPPLPEEVWKENLATIARSLAAGGGTAHL